MCASNIVLTVVEADGIIFGVPSETKVEDTNTPVKHLEEGMLLALEVLCSRNSSTEMEISRFVNRATKCLHAGVPDERVLGGLRVVPYKGTILSGQDHEGV